MGPFSPGTCMWMWAMNTFSMFAAISLYSSELPLFERWKIACAWPRVSRAGTSCPPFACTLQFPSRPAAATPTPTRPIANSPRSSLPRIALPFGWTTVRPVLRGAVGPGLQLLDHVEAERGRPRAVDDTMVEADRDVADLA